MIKKKTKIKRRPKKLKVAHVVPATPHACGMYETARDLVLAERKLGINAHIVDPRPSRKEVDGKVQRKMKKGKCPKCDEEFDIVLDEQQIPFRPPDWHADRGVCIAPPSFAIESDIIVSHSGVDKQFHAHKGPWIHVAHGRPNSSYRIEQSGATPIYSIYKKMNDEPRWKTMVTLWPGFEHYWRLVFPDVRAFNPFVNLEYWTRQDTEYDFGGRAGKPNVVVADIWRMDKDPFHVLNAFVLFAQKYPEARIHFYGVDKDGRGKNVLFDCLKERKILGELLPMVHHLRDVYSAADILITPHRMATRTVREALACGLQVVAGTGNQYTPFTAEPEDLPEFAEAIESAWKAWRDNRDREMKRNRETAEREFDSANTAKQFISLFEELLGKRVGLKNVG